MVASAEKEVKEVEIRMHGEGGRERKRRPGRRLGRGEGVVGQALPKLRGRCEANGERFHAHIHMLRVRCVGGAGPCWAGHSAL